MTDVAGRGYGLYSTVPVGRGQLSRPGPASRGPLGERPARGEDTVPLAHSRAGRPAVSFEAVDRLSAVIVRSQELFGVGR